MLSKSFHWFCDCLENVHFSWKQPQFCCKGTMKNEMGTQNRGTGQQSASESTFMQTLLQCSHSQRLCAQLQESMYACTLKIPNADSHTIGPTQKNTAHIDMSGQCVCVCVCMHAWVHACAHACVCVCVHTCVCVCAYVYACVCVCLHVWERQS